MNKELIEFLNKHKKNGFDVSIHNLSEMYTHKMSEKHGDGNVKSFMRPDTSTFISCNIIIDGVKITLFSI